MLFHFLLIITAYNKVMESMVSLMNSEPFPCYINYNRYKPNLNIECEDIVSSFVYTVTLS